MSKIVRNGVVYGGSNNANASFVTYDNSSSGLSSTTVQAAIDEVATNSSGTTSTEIDGKINTHDTNASAHNDIRELIDDVQTQVDEQNSAIGQFQNLWNEEYCNKSLLDTSIPSGDHYVHGMTDLPPNTSCDVGFLSVMARNNTDVPYRKLVWKPYISNLWYVNSCNNGVWSGWEKLVTESALAILSNFEGNTDVSMIRNNQYLGVVTQDNSAYAPIYASDLLLNGQTSVSSALSQIRIEDNLNAICEIRFPISDNEYYYLNIDGGQKGTTFAYHMVDHPENRIVYWEPQKLLYNNSVLWMVQDRKMIFFDYRESKELVADTDNVVLIGLPAPNRTMHFQTSINRGLTFIDCYSYMDEDGTLQVHPIGTDGNMTIHVTGCYMLK